METTRIPISGIDRQVDEYSPRDGSCSQIDKFRPVGRQDDPRWEIIPKPNEIAILPWTGWAPGTIFTVLKTHYAFGNLYAFTVSDDDILGSISLWLCSSGVLGYQLDDRIFSSFQYLDDESNLLPVEIYIQDFKPNSFYVLITPGKEATSVQHQLWKVTPAGAEPAVFRPELHLVQVTVNDETETTADFDVKYPPTRRTTAATQGGPGGNRSSSGAEDGRYRGQNSNASTTRGNRSSRVSEPSVPEAQIIEGGTYPGILKDKDKWFGIITAFKHPNGTWVKHSSPHAFKVAGQTASIGTNTEYATLSFAKNPNYTDNNINYNDNIGYNFEEYGHNGGLASITPWPRLGEIGVFMTTGKATEDDAYFEGTYYLIGVLGESGTFDWSQNEEIIVTGEVLNIDPYSHHIITAKTISNYGSNLVLVRTVTNFSLPGVEWHSHSIPNSAPGGLSINFNPKINETALANVINYQCAVKVTISTDKGTFYRWNTIAIVGEENLAEYPGGGIYIMGFPSFISYPDNQATQLDYYWYDSVSGEHELFYTIPLKPHPFINVAYNFDKLYPVPGYRYISYELGTNPSEVLDFSDNLEMMVEENEFKVSDLTRMFFPLEWSYQINDKISAVVNNTNEVAQGQFGDYPLYVFGENSVYGAQSGNGVLIAKFDHISSQHGMTGFESYTVFRNIMYFVSKHGIHALSGIQIEDIYNMVEGLSVYFISSDPTTKQPTFQQGTGGLVENSPTELFNNILEEVKVGVNTKTREIIFSTNGGLLIFNEKYKQWYTYTVNGEGNVSTPYDFASYDQLLNIEGDLHILETPFVTEEAKMLEWGTGLISGFFSIVTNPFVINDFAVMKRIRRMVLKGKFIINGPGSESGLYALNIVLQGKRSTNTIDSTAPLQDDNSWASLMWINDDTAQSITSKYLKTNYGSFQAFRILIYGENLSAGSFVSDIISNHDNRGRFVI